MKITSLFMGFFSFGLGIALLSAEKKWQERILKKIIKMEVEKC